ncbi:MAG: hypothetical protein V7776_11445 [Halopseudomonas aestusnigri]
MSSNKFGNLHQDLPIGVVTYRLALSSGELEAEWVFSAQTGVETVCKGIATPQIPEARDANINFVGKYSITYYDPDGEPAEPWDLEITQKGDIFSLIWSKVGKPKYHGTGFISGELLVCGWRPTE